MMSICDSKRESEPLTIPRYILYPTRYIYLRYIYLVYLGLELQAARGKQGIKYNSLLFHSRSSSSSIGSSWGHCLLTNVNTNHLIQKSVWRKLATMPTLKPIQI